MTSNTEILAQGNMSDVLGTPEHLTISDLPTHLIDKILTALPIKCLSNVALINTMFKMRSVLVARESFFRLESDIANEMVAMRIEMNGLRTEESFPRGKLQLFRSHFFFELVKFEMDVIKAVCKEKLFGNDDRVIGMAKLIHLYRDIFERAKKRDLPPWHVNDATSVKLSKVTRQYLMYRVFQEPINEPIGARILELLHIIINKKYSIVVKLYPLQNKGSINATYEMIRPQIVNRPPNLTNEESQIPTEEDKTKIISFLVNFIRTNNRVLLKDEQYEREIDASRGLIGETSVFYNNHVIGLRGRIKSVLRVYNKLPNPVRSIFQTDDSIFEVTEVFSDLSSSRRLREKAFICRLCMKCSMDDLPQHLVESWRQVKTDMFSGQLVTDCSLWTQLADKLRGLNQSLNTEVLNLRVVDNESDPALDVNFFVRLRNRREVALNFKEH